MLAHAYGLKALPTPRSKYTFDKARLVAPNPENALAGADAHPFERAIRAAADRQEVALVERNIMRLG